MSGIPNGPPLRHTKVSIEFTPPGLPLVRNLTKSPSHKLVSKTALSGNIPPKFSNSPYVPPPESTASPRPSNVVGRQRLLRNYSPLLDGNHTFRVPQPQPQQLTQQNLLALQQESKGLFAPQ